jgi:hypothetical protein
MSKSSSPRGSAPKAKFGGDLSYGTVDMRGSHFREEAKYGGVLAWGSTIEGGCSGAPPVKEMSSVAPGG